jgi:hypothetical protein
MRTWRGAGSSSGQGFNGDHTIELACPFDPRRFAIERRRTAEAALEQARGNFQEAAPEIARQRGLYQAAEARLADQVANLRRLRLMGDASQRFREQWPWSAARVKRETSGSGSWPDLVREGLCSISLLIGRQKYGAVRHLIGGPEGRDVRRWRGEELRGRGLHERGLDGSPDSVSRGVALVRRIASETRKVTQTASDAL